MLLKEPMIDKLFEICVRFLITLGRCTHMTYERISVVFNLWIQGLVLLLASVAPLVAGLVAGSGVPVICALAMYAAICMLVILMLLHRYNLPVNDAFALCEEDLQRLAVRWNRSYMFVNILIFVVLYLLLILLDILLVVILI